MAEDERQIHKYFCWVCKPPRTFLTPEAKARHMRMVHGSTDESGRVTRDPDLGAYYDTQHHMFRPGPMPRRRITSRLRKLLGLAEDDE